MPDIQINQSKINDLIRSILGESEDSEDSYQDVQLRILERLPQSEEEIKAIAKEVKKKHTREYFNRKRSLISLYEPIGNNGNEKYTLLSILAERASDETEELSNNIDPSARLILNFLIKEIVVGNSLNWSILSLLRSSSELLKRHHRRWEDWEDTVIRDKYARGGCLSAALFLNRTVNAIASRASYLGVRRYSEQRRVFKENTTVQEKKRPGRKWATEQWLKPKNRRQLESQCVREERLAAKGKNGLNGD